MVRRSAYSRGLDLLLGLPQQGDPTITAARANAVNNERFQQLRFERWRETRDAMWRLLEPHLPTDDARVLLVGAGNADDLPLQRIAARARRVTLVDIDQAAAARALARLTPESRQRVDYLEHDVTGGGAQVVVDAIHTRAVPPTHLDLPTSGLAGANYDLVVGDMIYTQLLQPALVQIGLSGAEQVAYMRAYDLQLTSALVERLQRSAHAGGRVVHIHDVACWSSSHSQPFELDDALADPDRAWAKLRRHDSCDPQLALERLGVLSVDRAWWRWPFEPNKQFLARGTVALAGIPRDRRAGE